MPPSAAPQLSPQKWLEWIWSIYSPDEFIIQWQGYPVTIAAGANAVATGPIQIPNPYFAFQVRAGSVVTATGAVPTIRYRLGIKNAAQNDWTNGEVMASLWSEDNLAGSIYTTEWMLPREVSRNEVLTVTIDNTVNAASAAITVDVMLHGYEVRRRAVPIRRADPDRIVWGG
jgi:hypothetical protein